MRLLRKLWGGLACAALVVPVVALAQQEAQRVVEEVIVTGSLVRGTPVDAALPVEVYTAADMELSGSPTALEFAKSLSIQGGTTGESYYFSGAELTGNVQYNLRGIGADKSLSLFNGRRVNQNASVIPYAALSRVEILKDGAAVTYGADATGGVVNFITRDRFEGLELSGSYKAIDGSSNDHSLSMLGGFGSDHTNVLFAAQWEHRSELSTTKRSFSSQPYAQNPAPWSTLTNLAGWLPRGALPAEPTRVAGDTFATAEWGNLLGGTQSDFTQESCEAVGGTWVSTFSCAYNYIPYYNLVEDNETYRLYAQVNSHVTDTTDFRMRIAHARIYTPHAYGSPSQPVIRGPAIATGATYQLYVPTTNPHVAEFMERSGWSSNPLSAFTQGFTPITYRAFAHGGLDVFAYGNNQSTPRKIENKYWHATAELVGEFDNGIAWDLGVTYNQSLLSNDNPDIALYRVQQALNGFGGPNCNVPDLDPNRFGTQNPALAGTGSCLWFNPFASNFAGQPVLGLANPSHVPGSENSEDLVRWIFNDRYQETNAWSITTDLVFSGLAPMVELPGGPIAWGTGVQWRQTKLRQSVPDPLYNGGQLCPWPNDQGQVPLPTDDPNFNGCTPDNPGPFQFFGINTPSATDQRQYSIFGELNFPILDSVYMTAAVRHERFEPADLDATVYKVSGKWEITGNLAVRGSYGTNYQAPGADIIPGDLTNAVNSYTIAGGNWRGAQTFTRSDIEPEEATVWGVGAIWQSQGFTPDSTFRLIVDYFDIETENELGFLATANDIASSVFSISPGGPGAPVPTNGTALADCSHPLVGRVTFNGDCVQGETTAADFSSIRRDFGNGPGQLTAGFDVQTSYSFPLYAGYLGLGLTATRVTKFEFTETTLDGFVLDPGADRLGNLNFATIGLASSKWRANFNANYSQDIHNIRLVLNYISGVKDERFFDDDGNLAGAAALTPAGRQPGTTDPFGPSLFGVRGKDWISADLHYVVDLPWVTVGASIVNIADRDPPDSRQELGYDPRIGNALGRTFELSLRRQF
jgi:iron complex outermembrane recepter protein